MEPAEIAIIAAVLLGFTAVSRRLDSSPITMPMVFVAAGAVLSATGVVEVAEELEAISLIAEVTLAVILFSDATRLSLPRLRQAAALPARLLGIGLPLTVLLGLALNLVIFPGWPVAQALLLAAILAPTDAALGTAVVSNPDVPARDRLALNVESGLNDGLVVPVVAVAASIVVEMEQSFSSWSGFVAQQLGLGVVIGLGVGLVGITVLRTTRNAGWSDGRYEQIATFGLPILAFTFAAASSGNGFIAAFIAGLAFGSGGFARDQTDDEMEGPDDAEHLAEFTEDAAELLGAVTFFMFGNLFVGDALGAFGPAVIVAAILSLTVARMLPVFLALFRSGCDTTGKLFIGWFGPRGLASIVFAILLVEQLEERSEQADQLVGVISLTVTFSVFLHGMTSALGARRYAEHTRRVSQTAGDAEMEAMLPRTRSSGNRPQA